MILATEMRKDVVTVVTWTNGGAEYTRSVDSKNEELQNVC